jgi:AcrR family transcriptional regulator
MSGNGKQVDSTGERPLGPRGQATRARLLRAAEECFGTHGYAATSVSEIVRQAGVSQGGFYVYFSTKEEIFAALIRDMADEIRQVLSANIDVSSSRADAEVAGTRAFFQWLMEHPHHHRILHLVDEVDEDLAREFFMSISTPYTEALRRAMDDDDIPRVDPELLAYALMGIGHFLSMRWILWAGGEFPAALDDDLRTILSGTLGLEPSPRKKSAKPKAKAKAKAKKAS